MTKALLLDCDGVLADTELYGHLPAFNQTFEEMGFPFRWTAEQYGKLLVVGGGKERFRKFISEHPEFSDLADGNLAELSIKVHKRKSEIYVEKISSGEIPARPGIKRLTEEALEAGWLVASASTSAVSSVEAVLEATIGKTNRANMAGVFAGDMVEHKKPAPDVYLMALSELGITNRDAVVIEDSLQGATAAAGAGLPHIITLSSYTTHEKFLDATSVFDTLRDPGIPCELIAGNDIRQAGLVTVKSLEKVLLSAD